MLNKVPYEKEPRFIIGAVLLLVGFAMFMSMHGSHMSIAGMIV